MSMMNENNESSLPSLESRGANIQRKHKEVNRLARDSVAKARECGDLLIEAKALVPKKKFKAFVEAQCGLKMRTAQMYMQLARLLHEAGPKKTQQVAHLTLNGVLKALSGRPKPEPLDPIRPVPESTTSEQAAESPDVTGAIPEAHGAQSATYSATKTGPAAEDEAFPESSATEVTEGDIRDIYVTATYLLGRALLVLQVGQVQFDHERQALERVREMIQKEVAMLEQM